MVQQLPQERWKKYLTDYNEGLGLVYERLVLNDYLDRVVSQHSIRTVLEAPIFGMAGVSGINSVRLAQRGCAVTFVDDNAERLQSIARIWSELNLRATFTYHTDFAHLPFDDNSFDLTWEWAGLVVFAKCGSVAQRVGARLAQTRFRRDAEPRAGRLLDAQVLARTRFCELRR